jgi:hypothetical protein
MSGWTFTPLGADSARRPADFPRVSPDEQAARDAVAEQLVADELATTDTSNPQAQAALEQEFERRFGKPAPAWKFTQADQGARAGGGFRFVPLEAEQPAAIKPGEVLRNVLLENPGTAALETAANLGSQIVALPVAGLAGLATAAGHALGLTDRTGADVVHAVGERLTYVPRGEMGQGGAGIVAAPFEKLHEVATSAGEKTLEATGSPGLATAAHTAIEGVLPLAVGPGVKAGKAGVAKMRERATETKAPGAEPVPSEFKFQPLEATDAQTTSAAPARVQRVAGDDPAVLGPEAAGVEVVRSPGNPSVPGVAGEFRFVPRRDGAGAEPAALARAAGREGPLLPGELRLDDPAAAAEPARVLQEGDGRRLGDDGGAGSAFARPADAEHGAAPAGERAAARGEGGQTLQEVALADLERRDAAAPRMGEADPGVAADDLGAAGGRPAHGDGPDPRMAPATARWALIEADDIRASHDVDIRPAPNYPDNFGRWDAKRHETEAAVQDIVGRFDPARLLEDPTDAGGAPIVAPDGLVEVGNRRAIALQRIYQANGAKAEAYRQHLREQAPTLGLDPAAIDRMRKPTLVRLPDRPAERRAFADEVDLADGDVQSMVAPSSAGPAASIQDLVQRATTGAGDRVRERPAWFVLGKVEEVRAREIAKAIRERNGAEVDVAGFRHYMDQDAVRKVLNDHGNPAREAKHGQVAVTPGDFELVPRIIKEGRIADAGATKQGLHAVVYEAKIGDVFYYVEEVRTGRQGLAMKTMWKRPGRTAPGASPVSMPSPEAVPGSRTRSIADDTQGMAAGVQNSFAPGSRYTGFIGDAGTPASAPSAAPVRSKPITREEVLVPFMQALGVPIYEGRIRGKGKLGHYRPKLEEVRIKRKSDLETAAHEVGHLLDDRVKEISHAWRTDKALREELKSISYDQLKVSEGYAEGIRLFLTQPDVLEAKAPKVHAWLEDFAARNKEYGPALRKAQEGFTGWFGQDAINRARSKIGARRPINEALDGFWDKFRQATVDDLHGIYRMECNLKGGKIEPAGAYESARLARASHSITDGAIRFGYPVKKADGSFTYRGKGLEEILKPVAEGLDDALLYFVGKSANELMSQGREHLFTRGEINAMLRLGTPERDLAFAEYQAWNKGILDFAEAQGIINPESRRLWQRTQYLPFHRVQQPGGLKGKPGDWRGIQALTGGTDNLRDILGNMTANAAMLIERAVKNEARQKVAALADKEQGGARFMVKVDTESRPVKVAGDQVLAEMFKRYGIGVEGDAPAFFQFMIHGQPPAGGNVVAVLKGGKPTWYEVADPILYRSLTAVDRPLQNWVIKWLGLPKRVGQTTITLTADFMVANIARDTIMGAVMSRAGFRPVIDSLQGMRLRMTNDPLYKDYIANGGGLSSIYLDEGAMRTKLERFYGHQGIDLRTVWDTPSKLLHGIETIADAFEMSTRLGEYRRAIQQGDNPRHAAYMGRDVSTDFAMRGDSKALGALYDTVMFLRPAVVSLDRLYRGLAHDPNKGAIAAKAAMIAMASAGLYLLNRDDQRYQDLPDWDRDANWHIFVGDQHFRWPKIWEIGAMASAAERTVEKILDEDPEGLGKDFARILSATFNWNWMPQILAPLQEQATNRSAFTKAPLETPGMENVQPFLRAKPSTSETLKAAGLATRDLPEAAQINPVRAEALLRGYFNTWAMYGLMLSDKAFFSDRLPEKRADELPVVRRFYAQEPARHTRFESEFYDMLSEAKRLRGTMRELDDQGLRTYADQKEQGPLSGEAKPLERAAKNLGAINREMEDVRRDQALTPAEKRERLDARTVERNALLKDAVQASRAAQKVKVQTAADVVRQIGINSGNHQ